MNRHDITEILFKVALNTITPTPSLPWYFYRWYRHSKRFDFCYIVGYFHFRWRLHLNFAILTFHACLLHDTSADRILDHNGIICQVVCASTDMGGEN